MRIALRISFVSLLLILVLSFNYRIRQTASVDVAVDLFKVNSKHFAGSTNNLKAALQAVRKNEPRTILNAKEALKDCRMGYKKIESFLTYFFPDASLTYNSPAKIEVEEPTLEYQEPVGLQMIEALLFAPDVEARKVELLQQAEVIVSSAEDLHSLLYKFDASDEQLLQSFNQELVRIISLNITGFDAPLLKSGITESSIALATIETCLNSFRDERNGHLDSVFYYLGSSIAYLDKPVSFDSFDRLVFLTDHALPLQKHLREFINQKFPRSDSSLATGIEHMFTPKSINGLPVINGDATTNENLLKLGRKLFFETALSGNNKRSCNTCHSSEKYFTDGVSKSIAFDETGTSRRNAPSLLYAAFQYSQFWDGRVTSLEEQVKHVLVNPSEMNATFTDVVQRLQAKTEYTNLFSAAFPEDKTQPVSINNVGISLAAFIRTLNPLNSAFDQYVQGDRSALNEEQKMGFNLFMGKGQCGTCHFAPLFNGLVPPLYKRTEFEILGTPATDDFTNAHMDVDSGRFNAFPTKYYIGAFKTPTVRNAAVTGPYMHNGAFKTLEKVMEFYNKGGAVGLGITLETQTLSSVPLELDTKEIKQIVSFLQALTDSAIVARAR